MGYDTGYKDGALAGYKLAFDDIAPIIRYLNNICTEEEISDLKSELNFTASKYFSERIKS